MDKRAKGKASTATVSAVLVALVAIGVQQHLLELRSEGIIRQLSREAGLPQKELSEGESVCSDKGCFHTALNFLLQMDGSVNPCDDFYQFACGRIGTNNSLSALTTSVTNYLGLTVINVTKSILQEKEEEDEPLPLRQAREYFRQCMHYQPLAVDPPVIDKFKMKNLFDEVGGWLEKLTKFAKQEEINEDRIVEEHNRRESVCAQRVAKSVFGWTISEKYLEEAFDENSKETVVAIVDSLKEAFGELIQEANWLENVTKANAIKKMNGISSTIAYPDWIRKRSDVEDVFRGLQLGSSYIQSAFAIWRFMESKIMTPTDKTVLSYSPLAVTAWYAPHLNQIGIPAAILQQPLFDIDFPKFQRYAALGQYVAHEMVHGFDGIGGQFNGEGNLEDWWDHESRKEFDRRQQCISNQYSKYCYDFEDGSRQCINGYFTQGENIADNGALRISFQAYQNYIAKNGPELPLPGLEAYSPEQLFFIGHASVFCQSEGESYLKKLLLTDAHSPSKWRVNGVLKNSVEFSRAFNCSVNSKGMNPPAAEKCIVW